MQHLVVRVTVSIVARQKYHRRILFCLLRSGLEWIPRSQKRLSDRAVQIVWAGLGHASILRSDPCLENSLAALSVATALRPSEQGCDIRFPSPSHGHTRCPSL